MKKLFVASALAVALSMACQQRASAWSEVKFSAGVNLGWVGGGNRVLWGVYRSAPYPGGQDLRPICSSCAPSYGGYGYAPPAPGFGGVAPLAPLAPLPPLAPLAPLAGPADVNGGHQPLSNLGSFYQGPTNWLGN